MINATYVFICLSQVIYFYTQWFHVQQQSKEYVWYLNHQMSQKFVYFMMTEKKTSLLRSNHVRSKLWSIVVLIGEDFLGFNKDDIWLHSIRAGGAMAIFLSGTPVIIVMRVGIWSIKSFLEYIREQVEYFTFGVSQRMLKFEECWNLSRKHSEN